MEAGQHFVRAALSVDSTISTATTALKGVQNNKAMTWPIATQMMALRELNVTCNPQLFLFGSLLITFIFCHWDCDNRL